MQKYHAMQIKKWKPTVHIKSHQDIPELRLETALEPARTWSFRNHIELCEFHLDTALEPSGTYTGPGTLKQEKHRETNEPKCSHVKHFCETSFWTLLCIWHFWPCYRISALLWNVERVKCQVWSLKKVDCWVGNVACRMWSELWSVECRVSRAQCKVWSIKCTV